MKYIRLEPMQRFDWCDDCGLCHTPQQRQSVLRRLGDVTASEARDRLGDHLWPRDEPGERKLLRDLRAVRGRPKSNQGGAPQRLARAVAFVVERGLSATQAGDLVHCDHNRICAALRAQGLRFRNSFRRERQGWVRA